MLADAATVVGGKLYVHGGGWTSVTAKQIPTIHPALALVLIVKFDWHEANEDIKFVIDLVDEDGKPTAVRGEGFLRFAPTPFMKKGVEIQQPLAQMMYGLRFDSYGTYRFRVVREDQILASVPLSIVPPPMQMPASVA